jgi:hypothetical protein
MTILFIARESNETALRCEQLVTTVSPGTSLTKCKTEILCFYRSSLTACGDFSTTSDPYFI